MFQEKFSAFVEHYVLQLEGPDGRTRKLQDDLEHTMLESGGGGDDDDHIFGTFCGGKTMMDTTIEELKGNIASRIKEVVRGLYNM